jgi:XTP/dITP diphosphohydrolase
VTPDRTHRPRTAARPRLLLATRNAGKAREIAAVYATLGLDLVTLADYPEAGLLPEAGATYAENAAAKARAAASLAGLPALADDSGIEIDALGGAPGPRSRRFLGEEATDADRNARVLALLETTPEAGRGARYRAAVAIALPQGPVRIFEGTCEGAIARRARGRHGFGYDPIFLVRGYGQTMAELPPAVKNRISHRARALRAAAPYLAQIFRMPWKEQPGTDANTPGVPRGRRSARRGPSSSPVPDGAPSGGDR